MPSNVAGKFVPKYKIVTPAAVIKKIMKRAVFVLILSEGNGRSLVRLISPSVLRSWYSFNADDPQAKRKMPIAGTNICTDKYSVANKYPTAVVNETAVVIFILIRSEKIFSECRIT